MLHLEPLIVMIDLAFFFATFTVFPPGIITSLPGLIFVNWMTACRLAAALVAERCSRLPEVMSSILRSSSRFSSQRAVYSLARSMDRSMRSAAPFCRCLYALPLRQVMAQLG